MPRTAATARHAAQGRTAAPGAASTGRAAGMGAASAADDRRGRRSGSGVSRRRRMVRLGLALAIALLLVGLAGFAAVGLLHRALRAPTATDEAAAVCAYLRSRDYDALASEMDPAPAGAAIGAFDRAAFAAQLRALDQREGVVRDCALRLLGPGADSGSVVFGLTVRRAGVADPLGSLVIVERVRDGGWVISRASTFYISAE
jgi:hypothetical protein